MGGRGEIQCRAILLALAYSGLSIAACDIDKKAVKATVPEIEQRGVRMFVLHADVADPDGKTRRLERGLNSQRQTRGGHGRASL
jgi:hypothetical protein